MKVVVEKVPEGVRLSLSPDPAKKPVVVTIRPGELNLLVEMVNAAMRADKFRFEYQTG